MSMNKRLIITGLLILFGASIIIFFMKDSASNNNSKIEVIGHRGAGGLAPENTLSAVQKAIDLQVDLLEIDVQRTKDQVIIVLHDRSIDRTTTGKGKAKDLDYQSIKREKISIDDVVYEDDYIPTLEEVIQLVNGQTHLLIEVKKGSDYYPQIEQQIIDLIRANNASEWCVIQSFNDDALEVFHQIAPEIELHKLFLGNILGIGLYRKNLEDYPHVAAFNSYYAFTSQSFIEKVHKMGKKVNVWTVNKKSTMIKMQNKGVDGIISDYPNLLLEL